MLDIVNPVSFTPRETSILNLIALGHSSKEIARKLGIAACTVERHIEHARLRSRTKNRSHLIAYVILSGLLPAAT